MDATYGNIETIRALFLLNEILPSIEEDVKLGDISIIGNIGYDTKG
jgi:hypothetical protein